MAVCKICGQDHTKSVDIYINGHQYVVIYQDGDEEQVIKVLEGWANDPELNFPHEAAMSVIGELLQ